MNKIKNHNVKDTLKLHKDCLVVDLHADVPLDICARRERGETRVLSRHLPKLREGGIDAAIFAICIEGRFKPDRALSRGLQFVEGVCEELSETDEFELAKSASDVRKADRKGKIAVILGVEGGEVIEQDLRLLRIFHVLDVRSFGLTWNQRNMIADGRWERRTKGGLSNFGVSVIKECNKLHIILDLAHLSESGFWDVIELTKHPVIVSHTGVRAVRKWKDGAGHSDKQIKAIADNGGLLGICAVTSTEDKPPGTLDLVVKEIEYVKKLVGVDYIGYGPDYYDYLLPILNQEAPDTKYVLMSGLEDASKTPNLTRGLREKGFSDEEIRKILGENFLRILKEVVG